MLGHRQRFRNRFNQLAISGRKALLHQRGKPADKVDTASGRCFFQRHRQLHRILVLARRQNHGDRSHRNALMNDRHAKLFFDLFAGGNQIFGVAGDFVVHPRTGLVDIAIAAVEQRNTHGDGTHIQVFVLKHGDGFENIAYIDHNCSPMYR